MASNPVNPTDPSGSILAVGMSAELRVPGVRAMGERVEAGQDK
jgi:hypothetical protein